MRIAHVTGSTRVAGQESVDAALLDALAAAGARVERPVWHDPAVDWGAFDLAVVRTTWDYTERRDEFVAWAEVAGRATRLVNDADVLRWNTHKAYLLELEERGAPVVPTAWLARGDRVDLAGLLASRGWERAIVKPAVSSGSDGLVRVEPDAAAHAQAQAHLDDLLAVGDAMVQPYLASIETEGELSVVVLGGRVTHAVRKRPRAGEFRIQEQHGGIYVREEPSAEVAELARWVVAATGADLTIARVDLVADASGAPQLAELEATEPDLYLSLAPDAAEVLTDLLLRRAQAESGPGAAGPLEAPAANRADGRIRV